eukprot:TRINITY_DN36488_c0_g1_i1.p1 TRINITY_DN36488_c0_g1~~TRINITY_DN36488_c0_g1_i1.p1  ORF type:complete len:100 (+),score=2.26 TRINITY_DN36488_c0_g1_i1:14-313(+)
METQIVHISIGHRTIKQHHSTHLWLDNQSSILIRSWEGDPSSFYRDLKVITSVENRQLSSLKPCWGRAAAPSSVRVTRSWSEWDSNMASVTPSTSASCS